MILCDSCDHAEKYSQRIQLTLEGTPKVFADSIPNEWDLIFLYYYSVSLKMF